jgi:hypothetical protein
MFLHKSNSFDFSVTIHSPPLHIRKTSQQAVWRFFEAFRFAHGGGVPASQSDWKQIYRCLHASMTQLYICFQSAVNRNILYTHKEAQVTILS